MLFFGKRKSAKSEPNSVLNAESYATSNDSSPTSQLRSAKAKTLWWNSMNAISSLSMPKVYPEVCP